MSGEKPKSFAGEVAIPHGVVAVGAAGVLLIAQNLQRNSLSIRNEDSTNTIRFGYDNTVTNTGAATDGALLKPGESYNWGFWGGPVYAAWDGSHSVNVSVIEE